MKLALIPPTSFLETTRQTNCQLLLPDNLLTDPQQRQEFRKLKYDPSQFVILDNGAAEANQCSDEQLLWLANEFQVDELALPDTLADGPKTLLQAERFISHYGDFLTTRKDIRLGIVCQGKTGEDVIQFIEIMEESWWVGNISTLYLPRLLLKESGDIYVRVKLANYIAEHHPNYAVHLFGASGVWPGEILYAAQHAPSIRSMDTSLPYVMAFFKARIDHNFYTFEPSKILNRPANYFSQSRPKFNNAHPYIEAFKSWAEGMPYLNAPSSSSQL